MKKIISLLLAVIMMTGLLSPHSFAAAEEPFTVVVSLEGETLGQGIYHGPRAYSLDEINRLLGTQGYGPYTEDNLTASAATVAFFIDHQIEYEITGSVTSDFYIAQIKNVDTKTVSIPPVISQHGGPDNETAEPNTDEWLGEFDYSSMAGWMVTCNNYMINTGTANWVLKKNTAAAPECSQYGNTYVIRWQFSIHGYGADLGASTGWGNTAMYPAANKDPLYIAYAKSTDEAAKAAALPVMENLTATQQEADAALKALAPTVPPVTPPEPPVDPVDPQQPGDSGTPQDPSAVLNAAMAQLAVTVPEPSFGTGAGEWTVMDLARGGYFAPDNAYFTDYYNRIVSFITQKAPANGQLHRVKSTENSRLIAALSSIGKDARNVGGYDLVSPLENLPWLEKQGINGPIWGLIALDTQNYPVSDPAYRQQLVDWILAKQLADGGWALSGTVSDPDMTGMALQSLAGYRDQPAVAAAAEKAFAALSAMQQTDGGFGSWGTSNSESISQIITAAAAWGINPDTDPRFVKGEGKSAVDALLSYYDPAAKAFRHVAGQEINGMATDQAVYALIAYSRLMTGRNSLYDMTDVPLETLPPADPSEMAASISLPAKIRCSAKTKFNAVIDINSWDNEAGFKMLDFIVTVPKGLKVTAVTPGEALTGGEFSYHLEAETGKLRVACFDANKNSSLNLNAAAFPAELCTISFEVEKKLKVGPVEFAISGMSLKMNSDSSDENSMKIVKCDNARATVRVVPGISYSAVCLYTGDDVDLIPKTKKAVAVAVTGVEEGDRLVYSDGTNRIEFLYNAAISKKTGVSSYIALVDSSISMENFIRDEHFTLPKGKAGSILFGDATRDGTVNAQDALAAVNAWLRKGDAPDDVQTLVMNVNCDSRINTFDALGIVESFVNGTEYKVVTNAATLKKAAAVR